MVSFIILISISFREEQNEAMFQKETRCCFTAEGCSLLLQVCCDCEGVHYSISLSRIGKMKEVRWLKDDPYVIMFREYQKVTDNGDRGPMS